MENSTQGFTPLIMACSQGYTESTKALLDAGANINYVSPFDGATALHHAVTGGWEKKKKKKKKNSVNIIW